MIPKTIKKLLVKSIWCVTERTIGQNIRKSESRTSLERANRVREIVRAFAKTAFGDHFPEIFNDLEGCSLCNQPTLLLVHPDMICYSCWIDRVSIFQQSLRELKQGNNPDEVKHLFHKRTEELENTVRA
jgi:hypothetical protein